jgi:hypothetical protein
MIYSGIGRYGAWVSRDTFLCGASYTRLPVKSSIVRAPNMSSAWEKNRGLRGHYGAVPGRAGAHAAGRQTDKKTEARALPFFERLA